MAYQRGSIRKVPRKNGEVWVLRFREDAADGGRRERVIPIGCLKDFPRERDARREVDRLGLLISVNAENQPGRIRFAELAEFYLRVELGPNAVRPKSANTIPITKHNVRHYLIPRWGNCLAEDIRPLDIQNWLVSLHQTLAWPTIAKLRGTMNRIYRIGLLHEKVARNPVQHVQTRAKSDYRAIILTPDQTLLILKELARNPIHFTLVLTCSATGLRASEILSLRWSDMLWDEGKIRVSKRWAKGSDGPVKTKSSDATVPLHPALAQYLLSWRRRSPWPAEKDFVFPSLKMNGRVPMSASIFAKTHLRSAAVRAGVQIAEGQRFGFHNLGRHSLSNFLINKAKVEPKTVQSFLRHAKVQTTLDLYTQEDCDETRIAQGRFLEALGMPVRMVQ